jgi:hypothetical protein
MVISPSPSNIQDAHCADATDLGEPFTQPSGHDTTMPSGGSLGEAWRGVAPINDRLAGGSHGL